MFSNRVNFTSSRNSFSALIAQQKASGKKIRDLTQSNPTKIGLTYNRARILSALNQLEGLSYEPEACGLWSARKAIAEYYGEIGVNVDFDDLFLTSCTSEAYGFLFKLLGNPGDQILIPAPGYPLLSFLAGFEALDTISYPHRYAPGKGWYMDFDAIEARLSPKTRAIVVVSPNNPTGAYLKDWEMAALDEICCRNNLAMIVDEVFFDYNDASVAASPLSAVKRCKALTFVLNGFSKMVALPQVKLGWIMVCGEDKKMEIAKGRLEMLLDFYLSVSAQTQHAAAGLMALRQEIQAQIIARIALNQEELVGQLGDTANCRMLLREGGWYAVVEIDDHWDDDARVELLLTRGRTLVHPGYFYDFHREGFIVISLLTQQELFKKGIQAFVKCFGRR